MKVSLLDIDGKIANLALMKISQFYKEQGDQVTWFDPMQPTPDKLYVAKLFNFTPDYAYYPKCEIIKGGTGFDVASRLPLDIDQCQPDYSIYPDCDYSIQFFSRGCVRNCPFCVVRAKEGYIKSVEPLESNPNGKYIKVLDNNFFSNPKWEQAISYLISKNQKVDMQGIDARTITAEQCHALNKLKYCKQIHIAWDNPKDNILPQLELMTSIIKPYKLMCYVLIGYWSTPDQDLYRVEKLRELKIRPFVMPFDKGDRYQRRFARWVNHKATFNSCRWEEYNA